MNIVVLGGESVMSDVFVEHSKEGARRFSF